MKKKQTKNYLGISALQIVVALSLMSMSAVLLASGFRSASSRGGSRSVVVVNPAVAGAQQSAAVQPAVVSPFSDEELAAQAAAEAELREAERTKQRGFIQPRMPSGLPLAPQRPAGGAPALQPYSQTAPWLQRGGAGLGDASAWQAAAAIQRALEWAPMPPARPKYPRVTCTSLGSGNWSSPGTWSCGFVPTAADDAIIANGHTVTIDTAAVALNLTVGQGTSGILQYDPAAARSMTVGGNVTISFGGAFWANVSVISTHTLSIGGNLDRKSTRLNSSHRTISYAV